MCCIYYVHVDTLSVTNRDRYTITPDRTDISWQSDRDTRFQNSNGDTTIPRSDNVQPKNWQRNITELENGLQNEDFIVWFRVSAFPNFIKLYARLYAEDRDSLPAGNYTLYVNYSILNLSVMFLLYSSIHTFNICNTVVWK